MRFSLQKNAGIHYRFVDVIYLEFFMPVRVYLMAIGYYFSVLGSLTGCTQEVVILVNFSNYFRKKSLNLNPQTIVLAVCNVC